MAVRAAIAEAKDRSLTVWYDGDCPVCAAEIGLMRRLDRTSAIEFVDLRRFPVGPDDGATLLARLHAKARGGPVVSGAAAFVAMWRLLPALRPLAWLASQPGALPRLERAYDIFLKLRPKLQAAVRWFLALGGRGDR